jgi:hypothetical protein
MRTTVIRVLVVGGFLTSVLAPTVASAAVQQVSYFSYVSVSKQAPAGNQTATVARCPAGRVALGGGVSTTGGTMDDEMATTAPFDGRDRNRRPEDGWIGEINTGSQPQTMTTYAVCAPFSGISYPAKMRSVQPGTRRGAEVACREGHALLGGGVRTAGDSTRLVVAESTPPELPAVRWRSAVNNGLGKERRFTTFAVCMRVQAEGFTTSSVFTPAQPGRSTDTNFCFSPHPVHTVSGGGDIAGGLQGELASLRPTDGGDGDSAPDDGWQLSTNNETSGNLDRGILVHCSR